MLVTARTTFGWMPQLRVLLLGILLLAGALANAPLGQGALEAARAAARPEVVARLDEYVDWCIENKLFADRDAACVLLIEHDPNHERARRLLKYARNRSGAWEQKRYKQRANRNDDLDSESAERRASALRPLRDLLFEHWAEGFGVLSAVERRDLEEACVSMAPDDRELRTAFGQAYQPEREEWVLLETLRAEERGALLRRWVGELQASVEVQTVQASEDEAKLGAWESGAETETVRVLARASGDEARVCAAQVETAFGMLHRVTSSATAIPPIVIYLLEGESDIDAVLAGKPHLASRMEAGSGRRVGAWDPDTNELFLWNPTSRERLEEAVEQALVWALARLWKFGSDTGWIYYGVLAHVTELTLGDSSKLHPDVIDPEAEDTGSSPWSGALAAVRTAGNADWGALLAASSAEKDELQRWRACVFTRFVAESYPHRFARIVPRMASGMTVAAAFDLPPGAGWDDLGVRVLRWAGEIDPQGAGESLLQLVEVDEVRADEVVARVAKLTREKRGKLRDRCLEAALACGAPQVELIEKLVATLPSLADLPGPTEFPAHDADEHKGGPTRRYLDEGDSMWQRLVPRLTLNPPEPRVERARAARYEYSTGTVVRTELDEREAAAEIEGLLEGRLPAQDLAEAALLAAFDAGGPLRKVAHYFAHTYCDREAFAYSGLSLFDMWSSGAEVEVPDPDARAYAHLVHDDFTIPVPLAAWDQNHWYPRMSKSLEDLRTYHFATRALAAVWVEGAPQLGQGYGGSVDLLNAFAAIVEGDPAAAADLWSEHGSKALGAVRSQMQALGDEGWNKANARRDRTAAGVEAIRRAVIAVLLDEGLL